ncbi:hypothetical protein ES703_19841 [subsurface metagenome]
MSFAGNIFRLFEKENYKGTGDGSPIALSHIIQEKIGLEAIFHITCQDRNF